MSTSCGEEAWHAMRLLGVPVEKRQHRTPKPKSRIERRTMRGHTLRQTFLAICALHHQLEPARTTGTSLTLVDAFGVCRPAISWINCQALGPSHPLALEGNMKETKPTKMETYENTAQTLQNGSDLRSAQISRPAAELCVTAGGGGTMSFKASEFEL